MESLAGKYYKKTQKALHEAQIDSDNIQFDNISGTFEANIYSGPSKKDHYGLELRFFSGRNDKIYEIPVSEESLKLKPAYGSHASDEEWEEYFDVCRKEKAKLKAELIAKIKVLADEFDAKVLDILRQAGFERAE